MSIPLIITTTLPIKLEKHYVKPAAARGNGIDRVTVTGGEADGELEWAAVFGAIQLEVNGLEELDATVQITEVRKSRWFMEYPRRQRCLIYLLIMYLQKMWLVAVKTSWSANRK